MEDKVSLLVMTIAFVAAFAVSLTRNEYLFSIISLSFALALYAIALLFAKHYDKKNLTNQFE